MSKMTRFVCGLVAACCAVLGLSAWAANPVAVWKTPGTDLLSGGYTWVNNGGEAVGDALVIGKTDSGAGLVLDLAAGDTIREGKAVTLVIDAEVPAYTAQTMLLNVLLSSGNNVCVGLGDEGSMKQLWGTGGDYGSTTYTANERAIYAIRYSTAGTSTFVNGEQQMTNGDLKSSSDTITKLAIGSYHGVVESNAAAAEGVKVHGIALFAGALSNDEVANIDWDAEFVTAGTYNATVTDEGVAWDVTPPSTLLSGSVLNISGTGAVGNLNIPFGVTANLEGDLSVTLTNNGTVNMTNGTFEVSATQQSIKGTVNIAKDATFKSLSGDSVAWSGGTTLNVYGTLDLGSVRWTVGGSSVINCYGGCTVTAAETNTRALDLYRSGEIITVNKVDGEATVVSLPALSPRNNNSTINIASGMTVTLQKPIAKSDTDAGLINITGGGKLDGTVEMKGVAINLGSTNSQIAKFVAAEGTCTLKWTGGYADHICNNDSAESPFVTINSGATLKITGKDFSGWNGALTANGWIVNKGTLIFTGDTAGSRFWREHVVFGNGSTMTINSSNRALLMYGGAGTADACQFMLPSGTATIAAGSESDKAVLYIGNDGSGGWGDDDTTKKATGFSVGADATLTVTAPIRGNQAVTKWGAGTLVFANNTTTNDYSGTITLMAGTIKSAKTLTVNAPTGYTLNTDTESEPGMTIYTVTREPGTIYAKTTSSFVDAENNSVTPLAEDTIVVDSHCTIGQWGGGINLSQLPACAELVLNRHMDVQGGIAENANVTVSYKNGNNEGVYLRGNIGAGATVGGEGNLFVGYSSDTCTINDGVTISCGFGFQTGKSYTAIIDGAVEITSAIIINSGTIKLNAGATLTTPELTDATKIMTDVANKHVEYVNGKYVLIDNPPAGPTSWDDVTAEDLPEAFAGADLAAVKLWANDYAGEFSLETLDGLDVDAFLLDCAPEDVETEAAKFKVISVEKGADGEWIVKVTNDVGHGGTYGNGYVVIESVKEALFPEAGDNADFFHALLQVACPVAE